MRDLDEKVRCVIWFLDIALANLPPGKSKISVLVNRIGCKGENFDVAFDKQVIKIFAVWNQTVNNVTVLLVSHLTVSQDNFPERLSSLVVYPAGLLFYGIWNILRFFVDPVTQTKVPS